MASFFRTTFDNLLSSLNSTINNHTTTNSRNTNQPHSQGTTNTSSRGSVGFRTSANRPTGSSSGQQTYNTRSSRTQTPSGFAHFGPPPHSHQYRNHHHHDQPHPTGSSTGQQQSYLNTNHTMNANNTTTQTKRNCNSSNSNAASDDVKKVEIEDIKDLNDINNLCTKQLKMILIKNCIDFKGVFEKEVLREKVLQLWIDLNERKNKRKRRRNAESHRSQDSSDEIDENQLCKICMEREIDCVLLECGHYLTCVTCGRKLAECPICRQMVTRCVRTFRG